MNERISGKRVDQNAISRRVVQKISFPMDQKILDTDQKKGKKKQISL